MSEETEIDENPFAPQHTVQQNTHGREEESHWIQFYNGHAIIAWEEIRRWKMSSVGHLANTSRLWYWLAMQQYVGSSPAQLTGRYVVSLLIQWVVKMLYISVKRI